MSMKIEEIIETCGREIDAAQPKTKAKKTTTYSKYSTAVRTQMLRFVSVAARRTGTGISIALPVTDSTARSEFKIEIYY